MIRTSLVYAAVLVMALLSPCLSFADAGEIVGKQAPPFSLKTSEGGGLTMNSLKGKGVILNFWATWCAPCKVEMPDFEEAYKNHKEKGLEIIGVNFQQEPDIVKRFLEKWEMSFPIALDVDGDLSKKYGVVALPSTFFIDRNGKVLGSHVGLVQPSLLEEWILKLTGD